MSPDHGFGRCHLCARKREVAYCEACDHWFCEACRDRWFDRTVEFVKQLVGGKHPGCCGLEVDLAEAV